MRVTDKHGNLIDLHRATIGKLNALLVFYEGVVYRAHKDKAFSKDFLISMLPDVYGDVLVELTKRGAVHEKFQWLKNIKEL
jgi:hypothetical protein